MRHFGIMAALVASLVSAAQAKDFQMQVTPEAFADGKDSINGALWVAYGTARSLALEEHDKAHENSPNDSGDDFAVELAGRQMIVSVMDEMAKEAEKADPYFKILKDISAAGFLDEYVVAAFARPGWTIPAENVKAFDFDGFQSWRREHPIGEKHPTHVLTASAKGKVHPDIPGHDLKDPDQFAITRDACADTRKQSAIEWKAWEEKAKLLDGRAFAANTRTEFITLLQLLARKGVPPEGVTWVSPRPATFAFKSGYCAVELDDYENSIDMLRAAVGLYPTNVLARMELVTVLNQMQKLDESEELIETTLTLTNDRCFLAQTYRRRGYLRIDQGRLEEARADYTKSLEYEPGQKIALKELQVIEQELQKRGTLKPGESYKPPPSSGEIQKVPCQ